ncbi:MAG: EF-P lysine aminoacylase GenX, partial [Bdellovibrionales bacterium]|nr:EF-P lysine aminoacylase GenX [Bdellovibrionales bacterium]
MNKECLTISPERETFLNVLWERYPSVSGQIKSMKDVYESWRRFAFGNERLPQSFLELGLRLESVSEESAIGVSEDMRIEVRWKHAQWSGLKQGVSTTQADVESLKMHKILRPGDIVLVETKWSAIVPAPESSRIELIHADRVTLLCPSSQAASENFPQPIFSIADSKAWANFLKLLRDVFKVLNFIEVRTPTLVPSPGIEPHLDPFQTQFLLGKQSKIFFLPTSPEYHLKKMLAHGWLKIFEFKESFRNGELSETHQPEFLMLEWYRAFSDLAQIEKDLQGMLNYLTVHFPFQQFGLARPKVIAIERISMCALFRKKTGFELKVDSTLAELKAVALELNIEVAEDDSWDDVFFRIFVTHVEQDLGMKQPLLVYDYPPSQAALARINERGWADRFELYYRGFEIANAYHELNDPAVQRERFQKDLETRESLGKPILPIDAEFLAALEHGMPPSSGIALGVERLFLALAGKSRLDQAR